MIKQDFWLVILSTRDRAGDTAAIAAVFSGRGLQIDSFVGFGGHPVSEEQSEGRIMVTFYATAERCQSLCRVLDSLQAVLSVRCLAENEIDPDLLKEHAGIKKRLTILG